MLLPPRSTLELLAFKETYFPFLLISSNFISFLCASVYQNNRKIGFFYNGLTVAAEERLAFVAVVISSHDQQTRTGFFRLGKKLSAGILPCDSEFADC